MKVMRNLVLALTLVALSLNTSLATPASDPNELIRAATTRPWPGENYPALPPLTTTMRTLIANEIRNSQAISSAYAKLDAANRGNVGWFEGVAELEQQKAVWSLLSCLIHPSEDVQIHALRSLERIGDRRAVPFLLIYAEHMTVFEAGSENATIHGVIHESVANTLSALTGVRISLKGQDPAGLSRGIKLWREWEVEHHGAP